MFEGVSVLMNALGVAMAATGDETGQNTLQKGGT